MTRDSNQRFDQLFFQRCFGGSTSFDQLLDPLFDQLSHRIHPLSVSCLARDSVDFDTNGSTCGWTRCLTSGSNRFLTCCGLTSRVVRRYDQQFDHFSASCLTNNSTSSLTGDFISGFDHGLIGCFTSCLTSSIPEYDQLFDNLFDQ